MRTRPSMDLRRAEPHHDQALLALMESAFRRKLSPAWWQWWNYACPSGPAHNYAAWDGDRPVGLVCAQPQPLWLEGRKQEAWLLCNLCVQEEHRGRGLFSQLLELVVERCRPALVVPNRHSERALRRLGASELGRLEFATRRPPFRQAALPVRTDFPAWQPRFAFQVDWTPERLRWRYQDRPDQSYRLYGEGPDYLVTKQFESKCHVLDWTGDHLAPLAEAEAHRQGARVLTMWSLVGRSPSPWELDPVSDPRFLLAFGLERLPDGEAWFSLGDNDVF